MIPCIKDKCLKYPACQNKRQIGCKVLKQYFDKLFLEQKGNILDKIDDGILISTPETSRVAWDQAWEIIQEELPNLFAIIAPNKEWDTIRK